ncbi:MAG: mercury transporter [Deltaproteobacteria bacterium CG2_30_43_15]|nr:MAG: mercury transporter [Deltaproteobacteria bacterium CG2_30_43_15]
MKSWQLLKIKGMSCNHCVKAVTKALNEIEGIKNVKVDLDKAEASYDEVKPVSMNTIRERIEKAGYEVE